MTTDILKMNTYNMEVRNNNFEHKIFNNLPDLIVLEVSAKVLKKSVKTLYDWNYRGKTRKKKIPPNLFVKLGGGLYVRKDVLITWTFNQSTS